MSASLTEIERFRRARWLGVVLFGVALPVSGLILVNVASGQSPPVRLLNLVLCLGLSLGAFGTANDTALTLMDRRARLGELTGDALTEHQHESRVRPARLAEGHHSPRMAMLMPIFALLAISWSAWRVAGEAGFLP